MVVTGEFFALGPDHPHGGKVFKEGSVIGTDQFLFDSFWKYDLICKQEGIICKYSYESFDTLKFTNASACSRIYNRIVRHRLYELIYDRKNNKRYFTDCLQEEFEKHHFHDLDFFVDFKVENKEEINNLFKALTQHAEDRDRPNPDLDVQFSEGTHAYCRKYELLSSEVWERTQREKKAAQKKHMTKGEKID